jgi:hypothetical protein
MLFQPYVGHLQKQYFYSKHMNIVVVSAGYYVTFVFCFCVSFCFSFFLGAVLWVSSLSWFGFVVF